MTSSLRPRLPSLFEPLPNPDKIPVLAPDPRPRESVSPTMRQEAPEVSQTKLRSGPSTISADHEPFPVLEERRPGTTLQNEMLPAQQETRSTTPQIRVEKLVTFLEEPEKRILSENPRASAVNAHSFIEENPPQYSEQRQKTLPAEPFTISVQKAEEMPILKKPMDYSLAESKRPAEVDNKVKEKAVGPSLEIPKTELNPAAALRPIVPTSQLLRRQQLEQYSEPEQQRVVEIHIGRVEVRAMTAPATQPIKPRSAAVMTLEEYLQRRNTRDH